MGVSEKYSYRGLCPIVLGEQGGRLSLWIARAKMYGWLLTSQWLWNELSIEVGTVQVLADPQ